MARPSDLVESMAIAGAVACLAHCVALPFAIALLPVLSQLAPLPTSFHIVALLFAVPTTLLALWMGYRRHRWTSPLATGGIGLALLALGVLYYGETPAEIPITIVGSLVIAAAHISNWRYRRDAELG